MRPIVAFPLFLLLSSFTDSQVLFFEDNDDDDATESGSVGDQCTADEMIDKFLGILTPDDYDEGKADIKHEITSYKEFMFIMNRLGEYGRNISDRFSEFTTRVNSRLSEALMEANLSHECLNALVRVGTAAKNGEIWALKCEALISPFYLNFDLNFQSSRLNRDL